MKKLFSILLAVVLIAMAIPVTVSAAGQREYKVEIFTSNIKDAETSDDTVEIMFIGEYGKTKWASMEALTRFSGKPFSQTFRRKDVGKINKIVLKNKSSDDWHLEWLKFDGCKYIYNDWLSRDTQKYVEFFVTGQTETKLEKHSLTLRTMDEPGAGTDAYNYIQLVGTMRTTGWYEIVSDDDDFERGNEDTYKFNMPYVGTVTGINIYSDGSWASSEWYPDWVKLNNNKYYIKRLVDDQIVQISNITGNYNVSVVSGARAEAEKDALDVYASTFATTDIWFIVSGGVLMLAVAVFAVIFVQRRKKKTMAVVESSDSTDQTQQQ